jgi:hypothetical protein
MSSAAAQLRKQYRGRNKHVQPWSNIKVRQQHLKVVVYYNATIRLIATNQNNIVTCRRVRVKIMTVSTLDDWIIGTSVTSSLNYNQYNSYLQSIQHYRWFTHFQFTIAHALGFWISTSRLLATDLKTETSTSNHYYVLLFCLQSICIPLSKNVLN